MRNDYPALNVLGIMSGTSLDGADAVLVSLQELDGRLKWSILDRESIGYEPEFRERLKRNLTPETSSVLEITQLHQELGLKWAALAGSVMEHNTVDLVAQSGQTIQHVPRVDPSRGWHVKATLQIGESAVTAETLGVPVISDFRQNDLAAGGEGAPLVPFADLKLFGVPGRNRSVHNLGGISNLTFIPADLDPAGVIAFDTGPANCLIDEAAEAYLGQPRDHDGAIAARGNLDERLLESLLEHPYLRLAPPKSTGREEFNLHNLAHLLLPQDPANLLATLTAFTAESIARAYREFLPVTPDEILVAGGGAHNAELMRQLAQRCPAPVAPLGEAGVRPTDRESLAFAVLGYYSVIGMTNTLPAVTGARQAVTAGKLVRPAEHTQHFPQGGGSSGKATFRHLALKMNHRFNKPQE